MRYIDNDPREIIARFNSTCAETGRVIKKGDTCVYYPKAKKVYHVESKQAEQYRSWRFDCNVLGGDY
jgi:hypothetical protein